MVPDRGWKFLVFIMMQNVRLVAESNIVEDFRQLCPYNDLCSVGKLLSLNSSGDYAPCCSDCFCDENCRKFHDCCPDVEEGLVPSSGIGCTTTVVNNPRIQSVVGGVDNTLFPSFRMTSGCPERFFGSTMTVRMCAERFADYPSSEDMVIVSNRYNYDDIYKNKHCAFCNGVQETVRWNLHAISCPNVWDGSTPFSELREETWNSCILYSTPPEHLKFSRPLFDCGSRLISTCINANSTYRALCEMGPYAPYYVTTVRKLLTYRNPFCSLCRKEITQFPDSCLNSSLHTVGKTTKAELSMLLRMDTQTSSTEKDSNKQKMCEETQIYDRIQGRCRALSCPWNSVVFYGTCLKFSDSISYLVVPVKLLFRPLNSDQPVGNIFRVDENAQARVIANLQTHLGFGGCELQQANVIMYTEKANNKQAFVLIELMPRLSKACSFEFVTNNTRRLATREYRMDLNKFVIAREFPMSGKLCFVPSSDGFDLSFYDREVIFSKYYVKDPWPIVNKFYICPYLKLSLSEYNSLMIKLEQYHEILAHINFTSLVYNWFYVLSDDVIAVCVRTYFDLHEKRGVYGVNSGPARHSYTKDEIILLTSTLLVFYCIFVQQIALFKI